MTTSTIGRLARRVFLRDPRRMDPVIARFEPAEPWQTERIRTVVQAFLTGYNAAVNAGPLADVHEPLAALPRYYRPFGYEGAAMGFGPWALLHRRPLAGFEAEVGPLAPHTLYQNYVGFGWWLAMRPPFARPSTSTVLAGLDHHFELLPMEGLGFRTGFLAAGRPGATRRFARYGAEARHVCHQGFGRSLWFVHMGRPEAARPVLDRLDPAYRGDCYSGMGLGFAYSWLDRAGQFPDMLARIPAPYAADFWQGAAFGWEARQLADRPLFDELLDPLPAADRDRVHRAVRCVHQARRELDERGHRTAFYQAWRSLTRQHLSESEGAAAPPPAPRVPPGS
ncbi:MAG TPA: DUF1702 family protein [Actinoplanes sp.]|nr:DUF1702 family protein [Actinoplanes sp.]